MPGSVEMTNKGAVGGERGDGAKERERGDNGGADRAREGGTGQPPQSRTEARPRRQSAQSETGWVGAGGWGVRQRERGRERANYDSEEDERVRENLGRACEKGVKKGREARSRKRSAAEAAPQRSDARWGGSAGGGGAGWGEAARARPVRKALGTGGAK